MGTYTTNYNLFMPSVGETGWGTLVNGNFTTIDTTIKSLSNRITAVENEVNGALNCTSVTTSGKVTGNGGIVGTTGTFSGAVKSSNAATYTLELGESGNYAGIYQFGGSSTYSNLVLIQLYNMLGSKTCTMTGKLGVKPYGYTAYYDISNVTIYGSYTSLQLATDTNATWKITTSKNSTFTVPANGGVNITLTQLNEIFADSCTVVVTNTSTSNISGALFIKFLPNSYCMIRPYRA